MENLVIRFVEDQDAASICAIYNEFIKNTYFTFEEDVLSEKIISERISQVVPHFPWLVAEINHQVVGYAYANSWKPRSAYRFSAESTIYLKDNFIGKGIGSALYRSLIAQLKKSGFHNVLASIALPNDESIKFHQKFGYHKVGVIREVGFKFNRKIDVAIYQLLLD